MKAAQFEQSSGLLTVSEVPNPEVGPRDVLVRVKACGICLSDVHLLDGSMPASLPVVVPGHEAAGVIEAVGPDVPVWQVGDRVVVDAGRPCGSCHACASGLTARCSRTRIMGFDYDGGWAEYVSVPFTSLCRVPDGMPLEQAAVLADAVSTPYAALVETAGLRPGQSIGLWGIGGLGYHAVQIARLTGAAPIVAVDPSPAARRRASDAGADVTLSPDDPDFDQRIRDVTAGLGLEVAVDLVGSNRILRQAQQVIARSGQILVVGLSPQEIHLGTAERFGLLQHQLKGHLGYSRRHLEEVAGLAGWGRLDLSRSVSATFALGDVSAAIEALSSKAGDPIRIIVTP